MSRVLITGATGFIGRHLTGLVRQEGHEVWATGFRDEELRLWPDPFRTIPLRRMDVRDPAQVNAVVAEVRPDAVYHLAAQAYPLVSWKDPIDTYTTNVLGTVHLFEALRKFPPEEGILVASSGAIYGVPTQLPIREDAPLLPTNPYGVSKACQDLLCYQYAKNFGLRILRARLFGTTGPGKLGDAPGDFASQVAIAEANGGHPAIRVGNLDAARDISDVRDVVRALRLIFEKGRAENPVNVGVGQAFPIRRILDMLIREARVELRTEPDPALMRPTDEPVLFADVSRLRGLGFSTMFPIEVTLRDSLDFWRLQVAAGSDALTRVD